MKKPELPKRRYVSQEKFCHYVRVALPTLKNAIKRQRISVSKRKNRLRQVYTAIDLTTELPKFLLNSTIVRDVKEIFAFYDKDEKSLRDGPSMLEQDGDEETQPNDSLEETLQSTSSENKGQSRSTNENPKTLNEATLMKARFQAMQAKVQYEKEAGLLIDVKKLQDELESIGVKLQKGIMAIPDRIAAIIAAETDIFRTRRLLVDELKSALVSIADDIKRISP